MTEEIPRMTQEELLEFVEYGATKDEVVEVILCLYPPLAIKLKEEGKDKDEFFRDKRTRNLRKMAIFFVERSLMVLV